MSLPSMCMVYDCCGDIAKLGPFPRAFYLTDRDGPLPVRWSLGWCADCGHARQIEDWPYAALLDEEEPPLLAEAVEWHRVKREAAEQESARRGWLDRLLNRREQNAKSTEPKPMPHALALADLNTYRKLLNVRQSTNRCMSCSSTHVWHWALKTAPYPEHLGCDGRFKPSDQASDMRLNFRGMAVLYDLEGHCLGSVQTSQRTGRPTVDELVDGLKANEGAFWKTPVSSSAQTETFNGPNNAREDTSANTPSNYVQASGSRAKAVWPRLVDFEQSEDGFNSYLTAWTVQRRRTPLLNQVPLTAVREHRGAMAFAREMGWQEREEE